LNNIKDIKLRCKYSYQKYPRTQITTTLREDLRKGLKDLSFETHQYETKILDMLVQELINNKDFQKKIIKNVKEYF
jgi:hypothetical protein